MKTSPTIKLNAPIFTLYVDGQIAASPSVGTNPAADDVGTKNYDIYIGADGRAGKSDYPWFRGQISQIKMFKDTLYEEDIAMEMKSSDFFEFLSSYPA